jgi:hypothetical protein
MWAGAFLVRVAGASGVPVAGEDVGLRRPPGDRRRAETDAQFAPEKAQLHNVLICWPCDLPICRRWPGGPLEAGKQGAPESGREEEGDDCRRGKLDWHDDALAEESATGGHFNGTRVRRPSGLDKAFRIAILR